MLISFYLNYWLSHIRGDSERGYDKRKGASRTVQRPGWLLSTEVIEQGATPAPLQIT